MSYFIVKFDDEARDPILVYAKDVFEAGRKIESLFAECNNAKVPSITEITKTDICLILE